MRYELPVDDWLPMSANVRERAHWARKKRAMSVDTLAVSILARNAGILPAEGKRRVSATFITSAKNGRLPDADNFTKSLHDVLTRAGLLRDDGPKWLELGTYTVKRGDRRRTVIVLEDVNA